MGRDNRLISKLICSVGTLCGPVETRSERSMAKSSTMDREPGSSQTTAGWIVLKLGPD